jgi:hypothetical protein
MIPPPRRFISRLKQMLNVDSAEKPPIFGNVRKISNVCQVERSPESFIDDFSETVGMF